ncbi:MAG: GDP-mannose 4,6-dehydratase [Planctomycetota bacterium]
MVAFDFVRLLVADAGLPEDWGVMRNSGLRVMVTGGAGFIGSELSRQLAAASHEVLIVDNLANGRLENVQDILSERVCFFEVDIRDDARMRVLLAGTDLVYHLACLGVRHSIHSPLENHEVNADATLKLLLAARDLHVSRFVYVSTSEVYGTAKTAPMTEEHPAFPHTVYGASKLAGECYARAHHRTYGYETVMVRPFNAFGPRCHHEGDSGEVIPKFLLRCMAGRPMIVFGDGTQTRDFSYVADTARGIRHAGLCDKAVGQTINLGVGREITINELAREVAGVVGRPDAEIIHDPPRPGDVLRLCAETSLARRLLDYKPKTSLRAGLQELLSWYRDSGQTVEQLLEQEQSRNWEAETSHIDE